MRKYKFLFKPLFFIFSLLFATWLVIKIEKISPSDFGRYRSLFEKEVKPVPVRHSNCNEAKCISSGKVALKILCMQYKQGIVDSSSLDKQLEIFFKNYHAAHSPNEKVEN